MIGWDEAEIKAAVRAYFRLLDAQAAGKKVNKSAIYSALASSFSRRTAKAFELKFQNISAVLYDEKLPFADGLKPKGNYQRLLELIVLDHVGRTRRPTLSPRDILLHKLRALRQRDFVQVMGKGSGRFGLTLEHHLEIPANSSKSADFMGIELKTKYDASLQTLFSRVPTHFISCRDRLELVTLHGYWDAAKGRKALYTSFSSKPDSLGFSLAHEDDRVVVLKNGADRVLSYSCTTLEEALLSKHTETAFVPVTRRRGQSGKEECRFDKLLYCKWPSILRFLALLKRGDIFLDFTFSLPGGKVVDHGFLWRIQSASIGELYLQAESITLAQ